MIPNLRLALIVSICTAKAMADTCLSQGELAGVVFGSVFGTLLICLSVGAVLYCFLRRSGKAKTTLVKAATSTEAPKIVDKGSDAEKAQKNDKFTLIDSYKLKRKSDFSQQKSFSTENVNEVDALAAVALKSKDLSGLGFSVRGSMSEGIYIRDVLPQGPAQESQNVFAGDRIRGLWISFDEMVFTDAITLLSYASPYKVKLELERKVVGSGSESLSADSPAPRLHPLFRSNSLRQRIQFNPTCVSPPIRVESESTTQRFALPQSPQQKRDEFKEQIYHSMESIKEPEEILKFESQPISEKIIDEQQDSQKLHSKMSSSDYSSNSDVSSIPAEQLNEENKEDGRSMGESLSSTTDDEKISDHLETLLPPQSFGIAVSPTPPQPQPCIVLPPKVKRLCDKPPSPSMSPAIGRSASSPPTTRRSAIPMKTPQSARPPSRIPPPTARAPDFAEVRVSRIPRRDSDKSIIIERKLPRVPSTSLNRSNTMDKDSTIWSRLYQEKRGQLKKTRDIRAKSEDAIYGTLRGEHRRRLTQNEEQLEKQIQELRQLGVL